MNREDSLRKNLEGLELYREGKYEEALRLFNEAIESDPENTSAWLNRSDTNRKLGREAEADADREMSKSLRQAAHTEEATQMRAAHTEEATQRREEAFERWRRRREHQDEGTVGAVRGRSEFWYAGFWRRFVAYLLDGIILNIISWVLYFILAFLPYQAAIVLYIAYFIGSILYFPVFWVWQGATPGKMIMGLEIVNADGNHIGIGRAILRYIGYFVSAIIIYIGYLMIAGDSEKQGLHDKIAGTYVVRVG